MEGRGGGRGRKEVSGGKRREREGEGVKGRGGERGKEGGRKGVEGEGGREREGGRGREGVEGERVEEYKGRDSDVQKQGRKAKEPTQWLSTVVGMYSTYVRM